MKKALQDMLTTLALNEFQTVYLDTFNHLRQKLYTRDYVDAIMQTGGHYTPSDVLAFAHIHHHICTGNIARLTVDVGDAPQGDEAIHHNNQILLGLPKLFESEFLPDKGAGAWDDGYFSGKGNAIFERTCIPKYQHLDKYLVIDLYNQWIPLEVGTTQGHTSYLHLFFDGALARWAYGSTVMNIFLLINRENKHQRGRVWKYHKATPLDFAIAKSQGFYYEQAAIQKVA